MGKYPYNKKQRLRYNFEIPPADHLTKKFILNPVEGSITKNKDCVINFEIPPADHLTKKFIINPIEGSRSAPTRSSDQNQSVMG